MTLILVGVGLSNKLIKEKTWMYQNKCMGNIGWNIKI